MAQTLPAMVGKNISLTIYGVTADGTGTFTIGSALLMRGRCKRAQVRFVKEDDNIQTLDLSGPNFVPLGTDWTLMLTEVKRSSGASLSDRTGVNFLEETMMGFDYAQIVIATRLKVWTFIGEIGDGNWDIERAQNLGDLTLKRVDLGFDGSGNPLPNPTYVSAA